MENNYCDLLDFFNDINNNFINNNDNNNICIKKKICKKIDVIKSLEQSNIDVLNYDADKKSNLFNYLHSINQKMMMINNKHNKLNNNINNILGKIIHNAYLKSGFHVLISNMPEIATQIANNKINIVDEETIYDTIEYYSGENSVLEVIKIDSNKYLAKFKYMNDARLFSSLIHKMQVETNIIKVEMLEYIETIFNTEDEDENKTNKDKDVTNKDENENENETENENENENDNEDENNTISDYGYTNFNKNDIYNKSLLKMCIDLLYDKVKFIISYFYKK